MMEQQLRRSNRAVVNVPQPLHPSNEDIIEAIKMSEEEIKKQRKEQEKADRRLAEEIQREERKAQLFLRERRGSGRTGESSGYASSLTASLRSDLESFSVNSSRKSSGEGRSRMTNNSLAACLSPVVEIEASLQVSDGTDSMSDDKDDTLSTSSHDSCSKASLKKEKKRSDLKTRQAVYCKKKNIGNAAKIVNTNINVVSVQKDTESQCNGTSKTKVKSSVM